MSLAHCAGEPGFLAVVGGGTAVVGCPNKPKIPLQPLVAMPGAPSSDLQPLVAMTGAPSNVLQPLVAMTGAPSSVLQPLVAMPGAPSMHAWDVQTSPRSQISLGPVARCFFKSRIIR